MALCKRLAAIVLSLLAAPAVSQESGPQAPEWAAQCLDTRVCEMRSEIIANNNVAARLSVLNYRGRFMVQYTIPLGVDIDQGVFLQVDENAPIEAAVDSCAGNGCTGTIGLNTPIIQSMKAGSNVVILFSSSVNQDSFAITFSLRGFTARFNEIVNG